MEGATNITQGPARIYHTAVSKSSIVSDIAFTACAQLQRTAGATAQVKGQITDSLDDTCGVGLVVDDCDLNKGESSDKNGGCIDRLTTGSRPGGG
jgi:hypothetical protein